jgi:hypothetical protein
VSHDGQNGPDGTQEPAGAAPWSSPPQHPVPPQQPAAQVPPWLRNRAEPPAQYPTAPAGPPAPPAPWVQAAAPPAAPWVAGGPVAGQWAPNAPGPYPGPAAPRSRRPLLIGALVVLLLAAGGGGAAWGLMGKDDSGTSESTAAASTTAASRAPQSSASSRPSRTTASSPTPTPTPTVSPEERALQVLENQRQESLQRVVLDGRWVAQVASKSVGITDPMQVAQNGTNTFYAVDILAESISVREVAPSSAVFLLQSVDFGKFSVARDGQPYWVTLVDLGFGSSDAVTQWCASAYSNLSAEQLANACAPRTLTPSHP